MVIELCINNGAGGRNFRRFMLIMLVDIAVARLITGCGKSEKDSAAPAMSREYNRQRLCDA